MEPDSNTNGWFKRLKSGLSKSSNKVVTGISTLFTEKKLDDVTLEELEDLLITSDLGVAAASEMTRNLAAKKFNRDVNEEDIRVSFASDIANILQPFARPLKIDPSLKPHIVLVCGVNGSGKTTTIGKLAQQWADEGKKVCLAAGDTFRAAAIEQLQVW